MLESCFHSKLCCNLICPKTYTIVYKFWWDEEMSSLEDDSIDSNKLWKAAGKPRQGPIFDRRQLCRLRYRKRIRDGEKLTQSSYANDLWMHKNGPEFWRCWRSKFEFGNKCDEKTAALMRKLLLMNLLIASVNHKHVIVSSVLQHCRLSIMKKNNNIRVSHSLMNILLTLS